jgi:hypothetical protein
VFFAAIPVHAQVFFDDFNRPDAPDLGPNYTNVGTASATRVISNQAGNVAGANNLSLVTPANFSSVYTNTIVTADIFHTGVVATGFAALAFGHNGVNAAGNGLYIKVQSQGGIPQFNFIGFYTGVGNSSTAPWTDPPVFFATTANFSSARMSIFAPDASTIQLNLDTDFNGIPDQTYTRHVNLGTFVFGQQVGLGVFGTNVFIDNFTASPIPEPGSLVLVGSALALGGGYLRRRRRG